MLTGNKNRRKPSVWLLVLILFITLSSVAVVLFLSGRTYQEMAIEQFNRSQLILARSVAAGMEDYFKELTSELSSLASIPEVQRMTPECLKYIQHAYRGFPKRTSVRRLDANGALHFIYPFTGWRGELIGRDYSAEDYFREAKETGWLSFSGLIVNEEGEPRVRIAVPVYQTHKTETVEVGGRQGVIVTPFDSSQPESGDFQGLLVGSFDPYLIAQDMISPIISGKTGYAWLLSEDGVFLSHFEKGFVGRNSFEVRKEINPEISYEAVERIQREMMAGKEGVGWYLCARHWEKRGEIEKLVAYTPILIDSHVWSLAVCDPVSEVEETIHAAKRCEQYTLVFVILALLAGGGILFFISYRWARRLEEEVARRTTELKETGDYLNNLIRYANAPIIVWAPDKRITIFNPAFEKLSGLTEAEMVKQPLEKLFPEESRAGSLQKIESALKGEYWETVEIPILRKDGVIRVVLWNSANIYGKDGKTLIATIAQGQDITGRRQVEEVLQTSERKYRSLFENINEPVLLLTGPEGRLTTFNRALQEMSGYSAEELRTKTISDLIHPDDLTEVLDKFMKMMRGDRVEKRYVAQGMNKKGEVLYLEVSANPYIQADEIIGIEVILRNITRVKIAEAELKKSDEKYWEIVKSTHDIIWMLDREGRFTMINKRGEEISGYPIKQWIGKLYNNLIHQKDLPLANRVFQTTLDGIAQNYEVRVEGKNGSLIWLDVYTAPVREGGRITGTISFGRDITQRKKAEKVLRERNRELQKKQEETRRLSARVLEVQEEERSRLARELHDEMGQSLILLKLGLKSLEDILPRGDKEIHHNIKELQTTADNYIINIRRILVSLHPRVLDILGLVPALRPHLKYFEQYAKPRFRLNVSGFKGRIAPALEASIFRIVQEALSNAIRHAHAKNISIELSKQGDLIELLIRDDGRGFSRAEAKKSAGLGIVGMRERVEIFGGTLRIESSPGEGTLLEVRIPVTEIKSKKAKEKMGNGEE